MSTTTRSAVSDSVGDVRTVPVGGGRTVAYATYGDPEGRPVLFLHGTPGSRLLGALFEGVARDEGVRVLAPDRPGCGVSDPHPGRTLSNTGEFLAPVLRDAGVSRAGVVGFSGGGPHALAFAATHADLVAGVDVVAGAVPPALRESTPRTQAALGVLARRLPTLLGGLLRVQGWVAGRGSPDAVVSQYTTGDRPAELTEEDAELVRKDFLEAVGRHRSGTVTESALLDREWDFDPAGVDVPVRLHHGERDGNVPVAGARRLADELGAETTVFEDADHLGTLLRSRAGALAPY